MWFPKDLCQRAGLLSVLREATAPVWLQACLQSAILLPHCLLAASPGLLPSILPFALVPVAVFSDIPVPSAFPELSPCRTACSIASPLPLLPPGVLCGGAWSGGDWELLSPELVTLCSSERSED